MNTTLEDIKNESLTSQNSSINSKCNTKSIDNNILFTIDDTIDLSSDVKAIFKLDKKKTVESVKSEDTLPDIRNYKNYLSIGGTERPRPTLFELQNIDTYSVELCDLRNNTNENFKKVVVNSNESDLAEEKKATNLRNRRDSRAAHNNVVKFGWIQGVLVRCILNIFGVMIFLRLSWVVGNAGVLVATFIILVATVVTFITALSASAICTNGEVKGGGAYYLISRSLGPEFGGAIGIVFSFANAVAAALYTVGFAETVTELMKRYGVKIIDNSTNDIRIIGLATLVVLTGIALIGMTWESKVQIGLLVILLLSFLNFLIGSFIPPSTEKQAKGFLGYRISLLMENIMPDFQGKEDFAHVFGVFFPAVTGILAGANISGNLKNPQYAIPKGTILSVILTSLVYLVFAWICGATVSRQASGNPNDLINSTFLNCEDKKCSYGLLHNYQTMEMVSLYGPIITAGIFSASLSSALASLISAPKIFQAVCADKIFPKLDVFAVGYGKNKEPWRAYALAFAIALACVAIGDLNLIAPIISNFFLMSYALINYSCFDASIAKTPGWRPAFKYYNKWISLFGALLCISVMFIIKWWAALVTFLVITGLYIYVRQAKPDINWGSSTQAHIYRRSLEYSLKLMSIEEHVKNFRPQCLVLTGTPSHRPALCDLAAAITKSISLMMCANVTVNKNVLEISDSPSKIYKWFRKRHIKGFYSEINANSLREGTLSLMQCSGIGKLKPNTLILGFKNDWKETSVDSVLEYFKIINDAFRFQYGVCILRVSGGLNYSNILIDDLNDESLSFDSDEFDKDAFDRHVIESQIFLNNKINLISDNNNNNNTKKKFDCSSRKEDDDCQIDPIDKTNKFFNIKNKLFFLNNTDDKKIKNDEKDENDGKLKPGAKNFSFLSMKSYSKMQQPQELKSVRMLTTTESANIFYRKHKTGFIDVWWLFDDGGLTILIPYLISQRKYWQQCKLRVFIQTKNSASDAAKEERNMAALLTKFRIKFDNVIVLPTLDTKPSDDSYEMYEKYIKNWRLKCDESVEDYPWKITDYLIEQNQEKINHYIRLKELLGEYSQNSTFIVVTITVPSKISTSAGLYMSWLDFISDGLPPVLMVRGNQTPVLTYYS